MTFKKTHSTFVLYEIAQAINSALSLKDTLEALAQSTTVEMGLKACSLRLLDPTRRILHLVSAFGLSEQYLNKGPVEVEKSGIDKQALEGKFITIDDVSQDPRWQYPEEAKREGIRSVLVVPLTVEEKRAGVLRVYSSEPYRFTDEDIAFLKAVANLGAIAIENARLYEAFHKISQAVNSALALKDVLNAILENTAEEMLLRAGSLQLLNDGGRLQTVAAYGLSAEYLGKGAIDVEKSPLAEEVLRGNPQMIVDVSKEPGLQYPSEAVREGIRSVLAVPLRIKNKIIGVLRVYSSEPQKFTQKEINFLSAVADLGAIAIENARLYEKLLEKCKDLEEDLSEWYKFLALG